MKKNCNFFLKLFKLKNNFYLKIYKICYINGKRKDKATLVRQFKKLGIKKIEKVNIKKEHVKKIKYLKFDQFFCCL